MRALTITAFVALLAWVEIIPAEAQVGLAKRAAQAAERNVLCWEAAVAMLDDDRTAPGVVALAAQQRCIREAEEACKSVDEAYAAGERLIPDPTKCSPRSTFFLQELQGDLEEITALVLEHRGKKRSSLTDAKSPFQDCVAKAIATLDDGISPADIIAAGAVEDCRYIIKPDPQCSGDCWEQVILRLKARTLPLVLKFRAARR